MRDLKIQQREGNENVRKTIGAVTIAILPMGKWLLAQGEAIFLCVTDFTKVKLPRESFHGYVQTNKRITHDRY